MTTIPEIQSAVTHEYGLESLDLISARRGGGIARARQIGMYLARHLTTLSLPSIGRTFGDRHHTTVLHGVRRVAALMIENKEFAMRVGTLRKRLEGAI